MNEGSHYLLSAFSFLFFFSFFLVIIVCPISPPVRRLDPDPEFGTSWADVMTCLALDLWGILIASISGVF